MTKNYLTIKPKPPYNFELSLDFLIKKGEGPFPELRNNNNLLRVFRINDKILPVKVSSIGTIERPKLEILTKKLSLKERNELKSKISVYLNLNEDLEELYKFMNKDGKLKKIKEALYGFKVPMMGATIYEVIIKAIIQQQISLQVAFSMTSKLVKKFGIVINFSGDTYYDFPSPYTLANTSILKLRSCGLSSKKAEYIINFSKEVVNGNFNPEKIQKWKCPRIIEELTKFKGIGRWTAELVAVAGMNKGYAPADDLGIRKAISKYYFKDKLQEPEKIREIIDRYPRGLFVYLLYAYRLNI